MINSNWQTVTDHISLLGEGPLWDEQKQRIIWLDILNGKVHSFVPETSAYSFFKTGQLTGAAVLTNRGTMIGALQNGFYELNEADGSSRFIADPEANLPENRFNDGKCDPQGRFWAGTMNIPETSVSGNLYVLDPDGNVHHRIAGIGCSNGLAWNAAGDTMYYIDSPTREVVAYDFNADTSEITNRRVVFTVPEGNGFPDGMTIDAEDKLWVALWDGWKVIRVDPDKGEIIASIGLPAARITSVAFGGADFNDLYITSARVGVPEEQLEKQPLAGSLFVIRDIGVKGLKSVRYVGNR